MSTLNARARLFGTVALLVFSCVALSGSVVFADPPIWESDYGTPIVFGDTDDGTEEVELGFDFPFAGATYPVASVNTNGGVGLTNAVGEEVYVGYEMWMRDYFETEFSRLGDPVLLGFGTDLTIYEVGSIYFNRLEDRAVFTYEGVAAYATDSFPLITFQIQLIDDGRIVYGYNGLFGNPLSDLDQGIVIGISEGEGEPPPGGIDYTANTPHDGGTTIYQIWCWPWADNPECFETGQDNADFDLDQCNLVFTPDGRGGFTVDSNCRDDADQIIFTPESMQFVPTPSGLVKLWPSNGYRLTDDGGIELAFDGRALRLPPIDCIDRREDGTFAFSPALDGHIPTPDGIVHLWHHNVYTVVDDGFDVLFDGAASGIVTNGCDTD